MLAEPKVQGVEPKPVADPRIKRIDCEFAAENRWSQGLSLYKTDSQHPIHADGQQMVRVSADAALTTQRLLKLAEIWSRIRAIARAEVADRSLQEDFVQEGLLHLLELTAHSPGQTPSWYLQSCYFQTLHLLQRSGVRTKFLHDCVCVCVA